MSTSASNTMVGKGSALTRRLRRSNAQAGQPAEEGRGRPRMAIVRCRGVYESALHRESQAFADAGFDVDVVMLEGDGHEEGVEVDGPITVHRLAGKKSRGSMQKYLIEYGGFLIRAERLLSREQRRRPFQLVHVMSMPDFLVFCTARLKRQGVRVALFMKEPTPELGYTLYGSKMFERTMRLLERASIRFADVVFAVTPELRQTYIDRGADPDKLHTVLVTPDRSHYELSGVVPRVDTDRFVIVSHGTIEERWGHEIMVDAIDIVRGEIPSVELRITGQGSMLDPLMQMVRDRGLEDHVTYVGWLQQDEVIAEITGADAGLVAQLPSSYSHLVHTTKMYELIMVGTPCIAGRLRATEAAFEDGELLFFEAGNPESLAEAIVRLHRDPSLGQELAARARARYEAGYSWDQQKQVLVAQATAGLVQHSL